MMGHQRSVAALTLIAAVTFAGRTAGDAAVPHITLERSIPADGARVQAPVPEVRLFFTGEPLLRGASIRVVNSSRSLMRSTPPAVDGTDAKQLFVTMDPPLGVGTYLVHWRVIAEDTHVMRNEFSFEVVGG